MPEPEICTPERIAPSTREAITSPPPDAVPLNGEDFPVLLAANAGKEPLLLSGVQHGRSLLPPKRFWSPCRILRPL